MEKHLFAEHFELESKHWWFVAKKRIILSFIDTYLGKSKKDLTILDAGCGAGLMLKDLQVYGKTFGMDFSEDAVKFSRIGFEGEVRRGWLPDNVPFEGKKFDLIICLDVIEHIEDDKKSLEKLKELLTEDGVLILTVPALMFLWSKWDDLNHHKRRYNRKQLFDVMTQAGLHITKMSYYNTLLFLPVAGVRLLKNLLKSDSDKSDTNLPSAPVNFILKCIFSLEKSLLKFFNFPIGVSLIAVARKKPNQEEINVR